MTLKRPGGVWRNSERLMIRPGRELSPPKRVFYVAGAGDAIGAHESWKRGVQHPTEVAITFSGQVEQYCADIGAELYIVAHHQRRSAISDGPVKIEHLPKPWPNARGALFHLGELVHAARLVARAAKFKADAAIIESGSPFDAWKQVFALFGMRVVPVLHNALWPDGFKPQTARARLRRLIDGFFWRHVPEATICVSPACARQVEEASGGKGGPALVMLAQFPDGWFDRVPPPPPHLERPFTILFVGRTIREKGIFDLLEAAALVEEQAPGEVRWIICGDGPDRIELESRRAALGLERAVDIRGWVTPGKLPDVLAEAHVCIVPTRSTFPEGLAMTAAEAALAGRPIVTNRVVPALEILRSAAVEYKTDDPHSCAEEILGLLGDREKYRALRKNAKAAAAPFLDRRLGLTEVLKDALGAPEAARVRAAEAMAPRSFMEPQATDMREAGPGALSAAGNE